MKFIDFWITGFALSTGMAAYPPTPQLPNDTLTLTNNAGIEPREIAIPVGLAMSKRRLNVNHEEYS